MLNDKPIEQQIAEKEMQIEHLHWMIEENKRIIALGEDWQWVEEERFNPEDPEHPIKEKVYKDVNDVAGRTALIPRLEEQIVICEKELEELKKKLPQ